MIFMISALSLSTIGRGVFGEGPYAPVTLHPAGTQIVLDEFAGEAWLKDVLDALFEGTRSMISVAIACASVGIITPASHCC